MRSAVFLPTPGMRTSRSTSPRRMASSRSCAASPESTVMASFGPMPRNRDQLLEQRLFVLRKEAVERQRILADVRVDAQPHLRAGVGKFRVGGDRDGDVVPHPGHVHDGLAGVFFEQRAAQ